MNTFDWLAHIDLPDYGAYDMVEISFKKGARKEIYKKPAHVHIATGDHVAVESTAGGYDVGQVSLMGELVELQLHKHRVKANTILPNILRVANERDMEKLTSARASEHETLIQARVIARGLGMDMKIGDVEYQGDQRKVTFYYTADGRVDFRDLIRSYAKEFKVKIEMRQIGSRQESARIGGIGACGRELCCSTWLTDFKSVSTAAARYQNLAINQSKLSGQCGRLKCCLNYELNTYLEVIKEFPKNVDKIYTKKGTATLIKTDIFKRIMYYAYRNDLGMSEIHQLSTKQVWELKGLNEQGVHPQHLLDIKTKSEPVKVQEKEIEFVDNIDGVLELRPFEKKKKKGSSSRTRTRNKSSRSKDKDAPKAAKPATEKKATTDGKDDSKKPRPKSRNKPRPKTNRPNNKKTTNQPTDSAAPKKEGTKPTEGTAENKPKSRNKNRNRNRNRNKKTNKPTTNKPTNNDNTKKD